MVTDVCCHLMVAALYGALSWLLSYMFCHFMVTAAHLLPSHNYYCVCLAISWLLLCTVISLLLLHVVISWLLQCVCVAISWWLTNFCVCWPHGCCCVYMIMLPSHGYCYVCCRLMVAAVHFHLAVTAMCVVISWLSLFIFISWLLLCMLSSHGCCCAFSSHCYCCVCCHLMVAAVHFHLMVTAVCAVISWLLLFMWKLNSPDYWMLFVLPFHGYCCVFPSHGHCCVVLPYHGHHWVHVAGMGRQLPSRSSRMWRNTARRPSWKSTSLRSCERRTPQTSSQYCILLLCHYCILFVSNTYFFCLSILHVFVSVLHTELSKVPSFNPGMGNKYSFACFTCCQDTCLPYLCLSSSFNPPSSVMKFSMCFEQWIRLVFQRMLFSLK